MSLEVIEGRLRALEDVEEIKRLEARYCTYCDNNHYAYQITNLFVEDAIWDGCIRGNAGGRYGINNFFFNLSKRQPLARIHRSDAVAPAKAGMRGSGKRLQSLDP